jgi:cell wall-associated NlpC family hydrolase
VATAHRARSLRPVIAAAATIAATLAVLVGPSVASSAAPVLSVGQVEARVNALNAEAERVTESYDAARDALAGVARQRRVAGDQLSAERTILGKVQRRIGAQANLAYRSGGLGGFVALVNNPDPANFLDQSAMLDEVSRYQAQQLAAVNTARHDVAAAEAAYSAQVSAAKKALAGISADRARIEGLLAQAQSVLSSLKAADRARLAAQSAAGAAAQRALRFSYNGPASGRAAVAVRFAYAQLGKPYHYGGAGPNSYDCSGLTMRAWGSAGVSLPHNAAAQQSDTRYVSGSDLQPGDLIFFGNPAYHVGIYIGSGRMIAAPHTGTVVQIQSVGSFSSAGRP